jgi:hypothetical protein
MTPTFDLTDWQLFVYVLFSALILFSAWQGWLHGLGRTTLTLFGVLIGYFIGKSLGFLIYDIYEPFIPYPEPIIRICADIIFACLIYMVFLAAAMFMFKSTRKQETLSKKLVSGIGGIVMGVANGIVFTIVLSIFFKTVGILNLNIPPAPGSVEFRKQEEVFLPEQLQSDRTFTSNMYRALSNEPIEKWVELFDPVPREYYQILLNLRIFSQRADLHQRFLESETLIGIMNSPEILTHIENSNARELLENQKYNELLKDESVRNLFEIDSTRNILMEVNWLEESEAIVSTSDLANHPYL